MLPSAIGNQQLPIGNPDLLMHGRLNGFQRAMLEWCELHPYSAIHVVRLSGGCDPAAWESRLRGLIEHRGLANLEFDTRRGRFHYHGGAPSTPLLRVLPAAGDADAAVAAEIERQLNDPFPFKERFTPVRFFAVPGPVTTDLGVVYFHAIADAESIARLLVEAAAVCRNDTAAPAAAPDLYVPTPARPGGPIAALRRALAVPGRLQALRRAVRPPCRDSGDFTNRFAMMTLDGGRFESLVAAARAWQVTVNDLLLAMLLQALAPLAPGRFTARRRRRLAAGCVVNLRRDLGIDSRSCFGLFLGSFTVTHEAPADLPLRDLAAAIRRQTLAIKRHKHYLGAPVELAAARWALRTMTPEQQRKFHRKNYPLWGGITNMKLDGLIDEPDSAPLSYLRAVSTGPAAPLVLSVTTLGGRMNLGVSYRPAMISESDFAGVIERLDRQFAATLDTP